MNIILIISDTYRYDNLFDRASMPVRTPHLDRFAGRAVSLSSMYLASFPTPSHRTDVTTGRYFWPWADRSLKNHAPVLLEEAGYVTQFFCDCPHLFKTGINTGFNGAYELRGQEGDTYFLRMNHPFETAMPLDKTRQTYHFQGRNLVDLHCWTNRHWYREEDRFAPRVAGVGVEWLEANYEYHPFFLWLDFFDPHEPWDPPEYMVKRYDPEYAGTPMIHPNYGRASDMTAEELKNLRAHYCAEAELADRWVGRVLEKIDDLGLWENSIVVFTSDHGMSLGEHNQAGKANRNLSDERFWPLYPEIAHVPFMVAAPGLEAGTTVDLLTQPVDILPTLPDLTGVAVTPPQPFHGRSFAPALRGAQQTPIREIAVCSATLRDGVTGPPKKWTTPVVYTDTWAYAPVGAEGGRELYRLADDPYGERNIVSSHPEVAADLHEKLLVWLNEMEAPSSVIALYSRSVSKGRSRPV